MKMSRAWAMPTKNTFDCKPIGEFVRRHLKPGMVSIDPFARNKDWATYTNDLNPDTSACYHMDSIDFLQMMVAEHKQADLVIFDPPYSHNQVKECYDSIGLTRKARDAWRPGRWREEKDLCDLLLPVGGLFLWFGWNTTGMGKTRGFDIIELLIVCHGSAHNDTLCLAERKIMEQQMLTI